jgi:hypothetical protein
LINQTYNTGLLKILAAWLALLLQVTVVNASAQTASTKWGISDNSFLIEESFNQEEGVFQNIFVWIRSPRGTWQAGFTQEWPAPNIRHQFSYTIPFSGSATSTGLNDILLNYRYQLVTETASHPAVSPRLSVILPTGRQQDGLGDGVVGLQFNIPASKQFGDFYLHVNAGATWLHGIEWRPLVGSSVIWQIAPAWNLMFEALTEPGQSLTWSPGVRRSWNVGQGQLVVGAAIPVTHDTDSPTSAAFLTYLSYETRFR